MTESETAAVLRVMLSSLGFSKPPPNITPQQLFSKLADKLKEQVAKVPKDHLGDPLFTGVLSEKQWQTIDKINDSMAAEYKSREDVLLKRLDVTMQSFTWSDRVKKQENELQKVYQPTRKKLKMGPRVSTADMLAARTDLLEIDKTSGVSVRIKTKSKLNTIVMKGRIPDRGGRTDEIEPPPPEMPSWQQRSAGGGGGRGGPLGPRPQSGRGGRGGGDQGRVQSNWGAPSGGYADNWGGGGGGYAQHNFAYAGQPAYGGGHGQQAYYGQQQGAAYYQDFYGTGAVHQQPQQQWSGDYHRGRGGGRGGGGRGRGGGYR